MLVWVVFSPSEKEAQRIRERLAQEEAEAMEMEDQEIKIERMLEKVGEC